MKATHKAIIRTSCRVAPIQRMGRLFLVLYPQTSYDRITSSVPVSGPFLMGDKRFRILPRGKSGCESVGFGDEVEEGGSDGV